MPVAPAVILIRPQLGENIGAVARAMSNFGLSELRLVAPKNGWPNPRAVDMAAGAGHIIDAAQVYATLPEAMHGIHLAYGTTGRTRDLEKQVMTPPQVASEMHAHIKSGQTVALLFGPERTGLHNDDITLCDGLITIPTHPDYPSLNLSQAMVILGYEWFRTRQDESTFKRPAQSYELADKQAVAEMFAQLEGYLDELNYFRSATRKPVMWRNLQNIFLRAQMNEQEVRTLRGLFRSLYTRRRERE